MFRSRKEDEIDDGIAPAQGSLLSNSLNGNEDSDGRAASPAPASSSLSQVNAYAAASAASRPVSEPISRPQGPLPTALNPFRSPVEATRRPEAKPAAAFGQTSAGSDRTADRAERAERAKDSRRVLTVGSDILLKGEIATCDRLVIEGKVDAVLNDVGTVELAESGSFKGVAQVENAEISGLFEGELVVKGRLVIYASGRVRGKITYGEIEIERGGELTGDIKTVASAGASTARGARAGDKFSTHAKEDKIVAA